MLKNPQRIFEEYQRRLIELEKSPVDDIYTSLEKRREKLERGISLLIDSYAQQYITKTEFEPRIQAMRKNLLLIQEQQNKLIEQRHLTKEIELIVSNLDQFSGKIIENLDQFRLVWQTRYNKAYC